MRSSLVRRSALALLVASLASLACSSDKVTAPDELTGHVFVAQLANLAPLPFQFASTSTDKRVLVSDKLSFEDNGRAKRTSAILLTDLVSGVTSIEMRVEDFRYVIDGQRVELQRLEPCPINALCIGYDQGEIIGTRIILKSYVFWANSQASILAFEQTK